VAAQSTNTETSRELAPIGMGLISFLRGFTAQSVSMYGTVSNAKAKPLGFMPGLNTLTQSRMIRARREIRIAPRIPRRI